VEICTQIVGSENSFWKISLIIVHLKGWRCPQLLSVELYDSLKWSSLHYITFCKRCADHEIKEIYAYGVGLQSILSITGLSKFINLESLSLHGNQIEQIRGLEVLQTLKTLNLSSNNISQMEGLSHLKNLHVLNLASNQLREISGLHGLMALRVLVLSHNRISLLGGLSTLHGPKWVSPPQPYIFLSHPFYSWKFSSYVTIIVGAI
jgi:Leucine-rich repeat (LRR) protein